MKYTLLILEERVERGWSVCDQPLYHTGIDSFLLALLWPWVLLAAVVVTGAFAALALKRRAA